MNVGEVSAIWAALAMAARDSPVFARARAGFPAGVDGPLRQWGDAASRLSARVDGHPVALREVDGALDGKPMSAVSKKR
jgi:hypothetical protein